jgi:hypothetical protein
VGQGFRRRPGHPDRVRAGRAAAGPDACAGRRLPGDGARGRDGRCVRLLPARPGWRRALDRHRDARAGGRRTRRPSAPGRRHRDRLRRRRRGADQGDLRRPRGVGAVAPARVPARPGHRRGGRGEPARSRGDPRRARHHRVGCDLRRVRGALAGDHPHRAGVPGLPGCAGAVRPGPFRVRAAARGGAPGACGGAGPGAPRAGLDRPSAGRALHRRAGGAGVLRAGEAGPPGRARHVLPGPLPAYQGRAAGAGPARQRPGGRAGRPAAGTARVLPRGLPRLLRAARDAGLPGHARCGPGDRAGPGRGHVLLRRGQADRSGGRRVLPP